MSLSSPQDKEGGERARGRENVCVSVRERKRERIRECELDRAIDYYARKNGRAPNLTEPHCCHSLALKYISPQFHKVSFLFI